MSHHIYMYAVCKFTYFRLRNLELNNFLPTENNQNKTNEKRNPGQCLIISSLSGETRNSTGMA